MVLSYVFQVASIDLYQLLHVFLFTNFILNRIFESKSCDLDLPLTDATYESLNSPQKCHHPEPDDCDFWIFSKLWPYPSRYLSWHRRLVLVQCSLHPTTFAAGTIGTSLGPRFRGVPTDIAWWKKRQHKLTCPDTPGPWWVLGTVGFGVFLVGFQVATTSSRAELVISPSFCLLHRLLGGK